MDFSVLWVLDLGTGCGWRNFPYLLLVWPARYRSDVSLRLNLPVSSLPAFGLGRLFLSETRKPNSAITYMLFLWNLFWQSSAAPPRAIALVGGALSAIFVIWAGFQWMTASGDPQKMAQARMSLIGTIVGICIMGVGFIIPSVNQRVCD